MKKAKYLISALLVLILSAIAMPVMAIGPEQAAKVGNNPNLSISNGLILDTPSGVHNLWTESNFNHWITASKGEGKMNNAIIVGPPPTGDVKLADLIANKAEYENVWIYFSQTMFRLFLKGSGMSDDEAVAAASQYPDGIYWHFVYVG